jgi:hypothetical protein
MNRKFFVAPFAAGVMLVLAAGPALAAAQTFDATGIPFELGPSPVGLPSNCLFANDDANFVFLSGNGVNHGTANKNGDWGGETIEGTAVFYEGSAPIDTGHLTFWGGGGNNLKGQSTNGFTFNFAGSIVSIHVNGQFTTNAAGTPTASVQNVHVTCS